VSICRLHVVETKERLEVRLSLPQGPVRTLMAAVVEASDMELLWLVGAVCADGVQHMEMNPEVPDRAHLVAASLRGDVTAHEGVLSMLARDAENNAELATLVYGEAPQGFRQEYPADGRVPQLHPGGDYALCMWGASGGFYRFDVRYGH
jgi:hypothetical protein